MDTGMDMDVAPDDDGNAVRDDFGANSVQFMAWLSSIPGATISSKIQLVDYRHRDAGRGVGKWYQTLLDEFSG